MTRDAAIATNRFGLGARPGEMEAATGNPKRWLLEQLEGPARIPAQFKGFPSVAAHIENNFYRYNVVAPEQTAQEDAAKASGNVVEVDRLAGLRKKLLSGYVIWSIEQFALELSARANVAATTTQPFRERLVRFWSNHLVVPAVKQQTMLLACPYEREVIRPRVTEKFADMLLASATSPAMIYFLDNNLSAGPNSPYGLRYKLGLNENLGREILELHTLGVDGGYAQADVIALSKAITGWSFAPSRVRQGDDGGRVPNGKPGTFHFYADEHEPGAFSVLGKSYAQQGTAQGEAMLADLARHPATATFLATKLTRHFTADDPSPTVIKRLADVYLAHDTNLGEMARALIETPEVWATAQAKLKQPEDYVISGMRSLDLTIADNAVPPPALYRFPDYKPPEPAKAKPMRANYDAVASMGQKLMTAPGPQGWYDGWADWSGADSLLKRVEWALATATANAGRVDDPVAFLDQTLGALASNDLRASVKRAATKDQAIGLVLASPEFQRR